MSGWLRAAAPRLLPDSCSSTSVYVLCDSAYPHAFEASGSSSYQPSELATAAAQFIEQHQKRYHICRLWASCIAGVILACTWAAGATGVTGIVTDHGAQHVLVTVFGIVGGVVTIWQRIW